MIFTGKNLRLVEEALKLALSDIQNQIGSCPAPDAYVEELEALAETAADLVRLLKRVRGAVAQEIAA